MAPFIGAGFIGLGRHPDFPVVLGGSTPWTPAELSTLVWFDASDTDTVTESLGLVSQWDDKSGNGYDMEQTTASNQPDYTTQLNGLKTIDFGDTLKYLTRNDAFGLVDSQDISIFILGVPLELNSTGTFRSCIAFGRDSSGTHTTFGHSNPMANYGNGNTYAPSDLSNGVDGKITSYERNKLDGHGDVNLRENGAEPNVITKVTNPNNIVSHVNDLAIIGCSLAASGFESAGQIGEIVILNSPKDDTNRQLIEGYLAWKWGIESALPSDHPYKNGAPTL